MLHVIAPGSETRPFPSIPAAIPAGGEETRRLSLPERSGVRNLLLRALPEEDFALLRPFLRRVPLAKGEVVIRPGEPLTHVYFPEGGLASVISEAGDGRRLEVGLFGREGMVSTATVLGADRTPLETFLQVAGTWLRIGVEELREAMARSPALRTLLLRYVQTSLTTLSSTALANGSSTIEERLARWLLMAHDRLDGDDLPLTHEFLALMLGVRRPGVTMALHMLEGAGMVRARRGRVTILDREGLEAAASDTYGAAEAEFERLIGPLSPKRALVRA